MIGVAIVIVTRHRIIAVVGLDQDDDDLEGARQVPGVALCGFEGYDWLLSFPERGLSPLDRRRRIRRPAAVTASGGKAE